MKLVIFALIFSTTVFSKDIQFNEADQFDVITMQGIVSVRCQSGQYPTSRIFQCYDSNIKDGNSKRLQILTDVSADRVNLKNTKSGIKKNSSINFSTNETSRAFNLWIETLTQKALLNYGENLIEYSLTKDGQTLITGTYSVNVEKSEERRCPNGFLFYNGNQCPDNFTICRDYFYKYRYCK